MFPISEPTFVFENKVCKPAESTHKNCVDLQHANLCNIKWLLNVEQKL